MKDSVKLDRQEIETAIEAGDNCQGRRWLSVQPTGEWAIHWADTNRPWDPWADDAQVTGIPALFPDGEGAEAELAQECLIDRLGREEAKRIENQVDEANGSLVEYADEHHAGWMRAAREGQIEWLAQAFLDACNGYGDDLCDPAPWGLVAEEVVEPPFEFEYA